MSIYIKKFRKIIRLFSKIKNFLNIFYEFIEWTEEKIK